MVADTRFLDTNVLLRYLSRDDDEKARCALNLLRRLELGKEKAVISPLVIFETVFTLQKLYRTPRSQIRDALRDILSLRGLQLPNKQIYVRALELYARENISFADAFHVAYMASRGIAEIYSWDTDFDHIEGLTRVEPRAPRAKCSDES